MPGLVGFTDIHHQYSSNMLLNMRNLLKHFDSYVDNESYHDKNIYASRTHLGIINQGKQPYVFDGKIFSWMEGEFYNQEELKAKYNLISTTDNELLVNIYNSTRSFKFLTNVDGCYAAALYDKKENIFLPKAAHIIKKQQMSELEHHYTVQMADASALNFYPGQILSAQF